MLIKALRVMQAPWVVVKPANSSGLAAVCYCTYCGDKEEIVDSSLAENSQELQKFRLKHWITCNPEIS